jgi:hypothetical protein
MKDTCIVCGKEITDGTAATGSGTGHHFHKGICASVLLKGYYEKGDFRIMRPTLETMRAIVAKHNYNV